LKGSSWMTTRSIKIKNPYFLYYGALYLYYCSSCCHAHADIIRLLVHVYITTITMGICHLNYVYISPLDLLKLVQVRKITYLVFVKRSDSVNVLLFYLSISCNYTCPYPYPWSSQNIIHRLTIFIRHCRILFFVFFLLQWQWSRTRTRTRTKTKTKTISWTRTRRKSREGGAGFKMKFNIIHNIHKVRHWSCGIFIFKFCR